MTAGMTLKPAAAAASVDRVGHPARTASQLLCGVNLGTLLNLPRWSTGPRGNPLEMARAIRDAGYEAVQGADAAPYAEAGLIVYGADCIGVPHEARKVLQAQRAGGFRATTLHLGTGLENDSEALRLIDATLSASAQLDQPVLIETHRATLTQDIWRTLRWIEFFPELRFNADLSHWYTGHAMPYGDFTAKLDLLGPVFARTGFIHGRIGTQSSMQVSIGVGHRDEPHLSHFRAMWKLCFEGFLRSARPTDRLPFLPELLPSTAEGPEGTVHMEYANLQFDRDGQIDEVVDRWEQASILTRIAEDLFAAVTDDLAAVMGEGRRE